MGVPQTYLMTIPDIKGDPFGRAISSADLVRGLKKIDPRIVAYEQYSPGVWYPGKFCGASCLWFYGPKGRAKISAFIPGPIPEWTQLDGKAIFNKGWREIFRCVIKYAKVRPLAIERQFHIDLGIDGTTRYCTRCLRHGEYIEVHSASRLCNLHMRVNKRVWLASQFKDENAYQLRSGKCPSSALKGSPKKAASPTVPT